MTSVIIPNNVTSIGNNAFRGCSGLTSVTIPNSVTSIGDGAFESVPNVVYHGTATGSPWGAIVVNGYVDGWLIYTDVTKTTLLTCSRAVTGEITIPNTVTSIGDETFFDCRGLTSITIPNSVTSIGDGAFLGCTGLKKTNYTGSVADWYKIESYSTPIYYSRNFYINDVLLTHLDIPEGMDTITDALKYDTCLISVTIPTSVTSIESSAFRDCTGLKKTNYIGSVADWYKIELHSTPIYYSRNFYINDVLLTHLDIPEGMDTITDALKYDTCLISVTIPTNVTSIGSSAFEGCTGLTSITIPTSVTSIGSSAFSYCRGLTSITIPTSVTSIEYSAFEGCTGLTSITIPTSVTSIGSSAFSYCRGLTSITIPTSVTSIEYSAFEGCTGLTSITIPASVTSIESSTFKDCTSLTSIAIPDGVTSIGSSAFAGCSSLTSVTIPNSVSWIGESAFEGCTSLSSVTIPNSVTTIEKRAFYDVPQIAYWGTATGAPWGAKDRIYVEGYLTYYDAEGTILLRCDTAAIGAITIPNSVKRLCSLAFYRCSGVTSITIPESVTEIDEEVFVGCSRLNEIIVSPNNQRYDSRNNCNAIIELSTVIAGCKTTVIPNSVTSIGNNAFSGSGLTSIVIPNSITSIGDNAFMGCNSLTSIAIPGSVTSLGYKVFSNSGLTSVEWNTNCSVNDAFYGIKGNITSFIFGNEVDSIPKGVCSDMDKLTSVSILEGVTSIGDNAFSSCSSLASITIPTSVTNIGSRAFFMCSGLTSITIPNSVTNIGSYAFYRCSTLASVTLLEGLISIGSDAFSHCDSLVSITIPTSVTSIEGWAFSGCSNLKDVMWNAKRCSGDWKHRHPITHQEYIATPFVGSINITSFTFGEEVEIIPYYLCYGMENLTSVTIPTNVISVEYGSFENCSGLTEIIWNAKNCNNAQSFSNNVTSVFFSDEVEVIPACICAGMDKLTSITIPNSVTSIGQSAFMGCSGLTHITIPNSVTSIGQYAFMGCSGLSEFTIPDKVTEIGACALDSCIGLKKITCFAVEPPSVKGAYVGSDPIFSNAKLFVPCGSMQLYLDSYPWYLFNHIECISDEPTDFTVTTTPSENSVTFEWPAYPNATTYTLEFNDSSIIFNNQGETEGGEKAELTQDGKFRYYWDSLESNTTYDYEMWSKDANGNPLCIYWNYFTTQQAEPVEAIVREVHSDNAVFFEWSIVENAGSYELIVQSKDQYGSEIFDSNGNVQTDDNQAVVTEEGLYKFGFTSLNPATEYNYQLIIKGHYSDTLFTGSGSFVTDPAGKMTIVPSANDFVFAWYANPLATSYEFTLLSANQNMLYSCTFDGQGKLWENGKYIEAILSDKTFTWGVKGVDPSTLYYYTMYAKYNEDKILNAYSGSFVTLDDSDGINNVQDNSGASAPCKIIRDGQVYIERGGKTYSVMGTEIR